MVENETCKRAITLSVKAEISLIYYFYGKECEHHAENNALESRKNGWNSIRNGHNGSDRGCKRNFKRKEKYVRARSREQESSCFFLRKEEKEMAANVESMFSTREKPWHGLGTVVSEAPASKEALELAGLDWKVVQRKIYTEEGTLIHGYRANVRDVDEKVLGVVSDRYRVVQNEDAFAFTDALLGEGVRYETAGSLQSGRRVWMLAKLPNEYIIAGEQISPYLVFCNAHDGSSAIKVAMTPVRVVCSNTLNLALETSKRCWSAKHTTNISEKLKEAQETLLFAERYMSELGKEIHELQKVKMADKKVLEYMDQLLPMQEDMTILQKKNIKNLRENLKQRYFDAPDLLDVGKNAYRFVNAVSDFATHNRPLRETPNYRENLFMRTLDGNVLIDRAYKMARAV